MIVRMAIVCAVLLAFIFASTGWYMMNVHDVGGTYYFMLNLFFMPATLFVLWWIERKQIFHQDVGSSLELVAIECVVAIAVNVGIILFLKISLGLFAMVFDSGQEA